MQPTYNRNKSRHNYNDITRVPRAGTKLRKLYDSYIIAEGDGWTNVSAVLGRAKTDCGTSYIENLRSFYGCEILTRTRAGSKLVGRWDEDTFITREQMIGRMSLEEYDQARKS